MRATHSLTVFRSMGACPPLDVDPFPPDADPLPLDADPPQGHETSDACWEACDNTTLPQTSFAGCKNIRLPISVSQLVMVILYDNS